jgi:hypothetical protein
MPVVIVGIIFHTGFLHTPLHQKPITTLIAKNFISNATYLKLLELGIPHWVNVHGAYTEVVAEMNPKYLNKFLQIMCENEFIVKNFEVLKKQLLINGKLAHNCHLNEVTDKVSTEIHYKNFNINNVFNEAALIALTQQDVEKYFDQYYKLCPMSIIVSGAVGYKKLIKVLQSTICNQPPRDSISTDQCVNQFSKDVCIENKYVGRTVQYFYKFSNEKLAWEDAFFHILSHELFAFFRKSCSLVFDYDFADIISNGDGVRQIVLFPKSDVSLADLQRAYEAFVNRICEQEISADTFQKIKLFSDYSQQFLASNLWTMYAKIKNNHLNGVSEKMEFSESAPFNSFCEKILKQSLILKIVTKYKSDK